MSNRILMIHFVIDVQNHGPQFVIPVHVREAFGWHSEREVGLVIFGHEGTCRFHGNKTMKSGPEIYGIDIGACLTPGERITVYAYEPPKA